MESRPRLCSIRRALQRVPAYVPPYYRPQGGIELSSSSRKGSGESTSPTLGKARWFYPACATVSGTSVLFCCCSSVNDTYRSTGAAILMLAYGYRAVGDDDQMVKIAEEAMIGFAKASEPGAFLVDHFPSRKCDAKTILFGNSRTHRILK